MNLSENEVGYAKPYNIMVTTNTVPWEIEWKLKEKPGKQQVTEHAVKGV